MVFRYLFESMLLIIIDKWLKVMDGDDLLELKCLWFKRWVDKYFGILNLMIMIGD